MHLLRLIARRTDDARPRGADPQPRRSRRRRSPSWRAAPTPRVQEVIVINQARILRAPEILDALLENPRAHARRAPPRPRDARRVLRQEGPAEARAEPSEAGARSTSRSTPIADLLEQARGEESTRARRPTLGAHRERDRTTSETSRSGRGSCFMTVAEKVQLAYRGRPHRSRMLLVRDRNRLICAAVMRNPRMSEQEVEAIAGMRNVDDEVLRILGTRRDWMRQVQHHADARAAIRRLPMGVVLPFINRLTLRDLKGLKDDKGVQQVVREIGAEDSISLADPEIRMKVNYYEILGVERSATEQEIRDRFRKLARENHPDRYRGPDKADAERKFQTLTEAVNVLTNAGQAPAARLRAHRRRRPRAPSTSPQIGQGLSRQGRQGLQGRRLRRPRTRTSTWPPSTIRRTRRPFTTWPWRRRAFPAYTRQAVQAIETARAARADELRSISRTPACSASAPASRPRRSAISKSR